MATASRGSLVKTLPSHTGILGIMDAEEKRWLPRLVVLRDRVGSAPPSMNVYDVGTPLPPKQELLFQVIQLVGHVDVADYLEPDLMSRLTLRRGRPRPTAFSIVVGDSSFGFEATSVDERAKWVKNLKSYIAAYGMDKVPVPPTLRPGIVRKRPLDLLQEYLADVPIQPAAAAAITASAPTAE